ncbi:MAG: AmmeMemoRadiSam system protein B [Succinivibrionaceae bacterium]|nr:AmmeMemoRadiSam system protein B [Succinivibrionaceae bacterium]
MRLPNIGVKGSELNRDLLDSWLQEKNAQFSNVEFTDVKALFMPYATSELCAQMVVQTMKQITNYSRYKRIVMLGLSHSRVTKGIYIPDSNSYRSGLTEFQMQLEPELEQQVLTCGSSTEISKVSQEFIDICDVAYNLPLIAGLTAELMLPIVPITYHRAEKSDLVKLIDLLVDNDSLMILCGGLSHSLSIQESKSLDSESISKVIALDSSIRNVQSNSYIALNSLIKLAEDHYWRPRLISYQSTGSKHNVKNTAGYASIVFFNQ